MAAIRYDFLPCFRLFQAFWSLATRPLNGIRISLVFVHVFWTALARFRKFTKVKRVTAEFTRLILGHINIRLLKRRRPAIRLPLIVPLAMMSLNQFYAGQTALHLVLIAASRAGGTPL